MISVAIAPRTTPDAYYFHQTEIPITIINRAQKPLLIEAVDLRFQGDSEIDIVVSKNIAITVDPKKIIDTTVVVTPTPRYLAYTNIFKIRVQYREQDSSGVGPRQSQKSDHPPFPYLIIRPPDDDLGTAFISFKQPDDRGLSRVVERFLERAGFKAYLAEKQPEPGTDVWDRVVSELDVCSIALILWTSNTSWGEGVKREIQLIRDRKIPHALIAEEGARLPEEYEGSDIEHMPFNREFPHEAIEKAVMAVRRAVLNKKQST